MAGDAEDPTVPTESTHELPFETKELREQLSLYLNHEWDDPLTGRKKKVGDYTWGVYAFYDFDGEPIYVGQTNERLRVRIRRHLTNQRTDAVAMNVLDPFEVCYIEVYPLPEFETVPKSDASAKARLNALEYQVYQQALEQSAFKAVLNEKEPIAPLGALLGEKLPPLPRAYKAKVISEAVSALRDHPDLRIARRASTLAKLAQVICERKVKPGLRRVLMVQAKRLEYLAKTRYEHASNGGSEDDEDE